MDSLGIGRKLRECAMDEEHEMVRDRCCPGYGKEMLKWGPHEVGVEERAMFRLEKFSDDSRGDPGSSLDIGDHGGSDGCREGRNADEGFKEREGRKKKKNGKYAKRFALAIGQD